MNITMDAVHTFTRQFLEVLTLLFALGLVLGFIAIVYMYIADRFQTKQTIQRNYPVIGRFRYLFEHMGEFFRQYFFAQDREELPFNRAQRSWVYRAAKNVDSTVAFGSTQPLNHPGDFIFLNGLFPPLEEEILPLSPIHFGAGFARTPYATTSFFNVSGMSYGAVSAPAISALSRGAKKGFYWESCG